MSLHCAASTTSSANVHRRRASKRGEGQPEHELLEHGDVARREVHERGGAEREGEEEDRGHDVLLDAERAPPEADA